MTKDELLFLINTKREFEFKYNGLSYNITYDQDKAKNPIIIFGRLYQGEPFDSFGDLMNRAQIDNHYFKDMLEDIPSK